MMTYYICAGQNGIVRCDKDTPAEVQGLATRDIKTCLGIAVINKTNKRMSLLHVDAMTDMNCFLQELEWINNGSQDYSIILVKNQAGIDEVKKKIVSLGNANNESDIKVDTESIFIKFLKTHKLTNKVSRRINSASGQLIVDRAGEISIWVKPNMRMFESPDCVQRHAIHRLNGLHNAIRPAVLEYDGKDFSPLPALVNNFQETLNILHVELKKETNTTLSDAVDSTFKILDSEKRKIYCFNYASPYAREKYIENIQMYLQYKAIQEEKKSDVTQINSARV